MISNIILMVNYYQSIHNYSDHLLKAVVKVTVKSKHIVVYLDCGLERTGISMAPGA